MKGFGLLLLYFFTWRSVILGSVFAGLALIGFAASVAVIFPQAAGALAMLAFVLLLAVPYLSAPKVLRTLISNRRLVMVPGLPLRTGLVMLTLTLLTAAFLPFSGWLLGAPGDFHWIGLHVFVAASLYTLVTQLLVTSRYIWVHINVLPIASIVLLSLFKEQLWWLVTNRTAMTLLAALACAGWLYALGILARRRSFKPVYVTDLQTADSETNSFFTAWVSGRPGGKLSPETSLLLGYPTNLRARAVNVVFILVLNPLLAVLLMVFMNRNSAKGLPMNAADLFLSISMFTAFVTGALAWGEVGARARLLWLRVPGGRAKVWEKVEQELWAYFQILFAVTAAVALVITLTGGAPMLLVHYALLLFTLTLYQRYLPLAARLNGWPSLLQTLVSLASMAAIAFIIVYSLRVANFNLVFLLEFCFLLLGLLFRAIAKFGFRRADWQALRPQRSKRAEAAA